MCPHYDSVKVNGDCLQCLKAEVESLRRVKKELDAVKAVLHDLCEERGVVGGALTRFLETAANPTVFVKYRKMPLGIDRPGAPTSDSVDALRYAMGNPLARCHHDKFELDCIECSGNPFRNAW